MNKKQQSLFENFIREWYMDKLVIWKTVLFKNLFYFFNTNATC